MRRRTNPLYNIDKQTLLDAVINSKSIAEVLDRLNVPRFIGSSYEIFRNLCKTYDLTDEFRKLKDRSKETIKKQVSHVGIKYSLDYILVENSTYKSRTELKKRLVNCGMLVNRCNICSCDPIWNGKNLVFILDHINGIHNDNRFENLQLVCPNCNSQLSTFSGRNKKYKH